jgi:hypothetical protein
LGGIGLSALMRIYIRFDVKDYLIPAILIILGIAIITGRGGKKGKG